MPAESDDPRNDRRAYQRRQPEHTLLYRLVAAEVDALREAIATASHYSAGLPRHVDKELDAFLRCGILAYGFARVLCKRCRAEHLVAWSCKGRGICPSCASRRMHDTAAHLVDRVLPRCGYRQWVITFPRRVRWHLAADPKLSTEALREALRVIFTWQRRRARRHGVRPARARSNGAVTFVQRFNSALEASLHFHIVIPDGIFIPRPDDPDARPHFVALDPPADVDVVALLDGIIERVTALLRRRGRLDDGVLDDEPEPHLLLAARPARSSSEPFVEDPLPPLCARKDGYSLHAGSAVHRNDRQGLEQLCRYGLRPPLAQGRLEEASDGRILYTMKRRFADGRFVLRFEPRELLLRLCALVPPRGFHMTRYHGLFAGHARGRHALSGRGMRDTAPTSLSSPHAAPPPSTAPPAPPRSSKDAVARQGNDPLGPDDPARARRLAWAALLRRSWGIDALRCAKCGSTMELLSAVDDETVARRILEHLGLPTRAPPRGRPWSPQRPLPGVHDPPVVYGRDASS